MASPRPWIVQVRSRSGFWFDNEPVRYATAEAAIKAVCKAEPWQRKRHLRVLYWPAHFPHKADRAWCSHGASVFERIVRAAARGGQ